MHVKRIVRSRAPPRSLYRPMSDSWALGIAHSAMQGRGSEARHCLCGGVLPVLAEILSESGHM